MRRRDMLLGGATALGMVPALAAPGCVRQADTSLDVPLGHAYPGPPPREHQQPLPRETTEKFTKLRGLCDGVPVPDAAEHESHVERARRILHERKLAALVVEPGPSMIYFSGVQWGQSERPFVMVVLPEGAPVFVCPAFEVGTASERVGDAELRVWQEHESPYAVVSAVVGERSGRGNAPVVVDPLMRQFIVGGLQRAFGKRKVGSGEAVVTACRIRKTKVELARLRRANEVTKIAIAHVSGLARAGMDQSELSSSMREALIATGLTGPWVLCLFGPNAAYPHGTKDNRTLREGELILIDTGGSLHGYSSDITRTWAFGRATDEQRRAWNTVRAAQLAALDHIKPGKPCHDADDAARRVIADAGYPAGYDVFTHRLGHGIGVQGHEAPYLRRGNKRILEPGMTMSNEPGIYMRGQLGARLEDIVAVTESGFEVFGPLAKSLDEPFG